MFIIALLLKYTHHRSMFLSGFDWKIRGNAIDLRLTEKYPAGVELYNALAGKWISDNPWMMDVHLAKDETKDIHYFMFTPDEPGSILLQTDIQIMENGVYCFYKMVGLTVSVKNETADLAESILAKLNSFKAASILDRKSIKLAAGFIQNVRDRKVNSSRDAEKNILDVLSAVRQIMEVRTINVQPVRLRMDQLLQIWEARAQEMGKRP